jgi:cytochrome oxidase Cu insertion factor (SCO1/SenC/PrrC family)
VTWDFLTTRSRRELLPILNGFGQDVGVDIDRATGKPAGTYSHVLKVFLIDRHGAVREIYTTDYLLPEMVLNDIKTLLMEDSVSLK